MAKARAIISGFDPNGPFAGLVLPPAFRKRQSETRFKQEWHLTLAQYAALMNPFNGPRRQRGSIQMGASGSMAASAVVGGDSVLMTGFGASQENIGSNCYAGFRFNTDGSNDEYGFGVSDYFQRNSGEWWTGEPDAGIGSSYEVRALSGGSGSWDSAAASDNIWITMTANRQWDILVLSKFSPDLKSASRTMEIGPDGVESADDSASYSATAEN